MKVFLRNIVLRLLRLRNVTAENLVSKSEVEALIQKLKPYATDKELIRLGPDGDGGYLLPDDLENIEACFSPGVGELFGFEEGCAAYGMKIYMADKSVPDPKLPKDTYQFIPKFIGPVSKEGFITIEDWVKENQVDENSDLILQMDIEGFEYLTLLSIPDSIMKRFRIIVLECHYLEKLWNQEFFNTASAAFEKVLRNHTCVHIHPNNYLEIDNTYGVEIPKLAEFTFYRNDRIKTKQLQTVFPHPLDVKIIKEKASALPKNWYGQ